MHYRLHTTHYTLQILHSTSSCPWTIIISMNLLSSTQNPASNTQQSVCMYMAIAVTCRLLYVYVYEYVYVYVRYQTLHMLTCSWHMSALVNPHFKTFLLFLYLTFLVLFLLNAFFRRWMLDAGCSFLKK